VRVADVYTREDKYPQAVLEYRAAIRLDPLFTNASELLGVVSARQHDYLTAQRKVGSPQ